MIHETAIIGSDVEIGRDVEIGPYSIVRSKVKIGDRTKIGPYVVIDSYTEIGEDCEIYQYASIGAPPQDLKFMGEETFVKIGRGTKIREFVTINRGTAGGGGITEVGEDNFLMAYAHIAHDCRTGKRVIMANGATLAGHITLGDYVTIGGLVAVHQFVHIGNYAYIGGKSAVVKDVPPFVIAAGDRAVLHGLNKVGLARQGFSEETLSALKKTYRILFRIGLTINEAIERVKAEVNMLPEVKAILDFIQSSQRGITR